MSITKRSLRLKDLKKVKGEFLYLYDLPLISFHGELCLLETTTGYYLVMPNHSSEDELWVPEATAVYLKTVATIVYNYKTKENEECVDL